MAHAKTIDEERMRNAVPGKILVSLDPANPPTKEIPFIEFPRVVYKHPKEPFYKVEHRNNLREIVQTEMLPSEHQALLINNKKELEKAEKDGWVLNPYVPPPLPDHKAELY